MSFEYIIAGAGLKKALPLAEKRVMPVSLFGRLYAVIL